MGLVRFANVPVVVAAAAIVELGMVTLTLAGARTFDMRKVEWYQAPTQRNETLTALYARLCENVMQFGGKRWGVLWEAVGNL